MPNGDASAFPDESLADERELLDDRVDGVLPAATEQEPGVEHDELRAAGRRDACAPVERTERRGPLPPARLEVPHPAEERRVHGKRDVVLACELAEPFRPRIIHPEARLEVDLAGVVPALEQELDRRLGALPVGDVRGAESDPSHPATVTGRRYRGVRPSDGIRTLEDMDQPTRIDLLELDIDLRLTELWREAADVSEWSLEVVSAFMRAAYGKGYCDALTEDAPGSLCLEHGYDVPRRRERDAARG